MSLDPALQQAAGEDLGLLTLDALDNVAALVQRIDASDLEGFLPPLSSSIIDAPDASLPRFDGTVPSSPIITSAPAASNPSLPTPPIGLLELIRPADTIAGPAAIAPDSELSLSPSDPPRPVSLQANESASEGAATVPEPFSLALLAVGFGFAVAHRFRRRNGRESQMLLRSLMAGVKSSDRVRCPHCQSIETALTSQTSPAYVCLGCGKPFKNQWSTKDDKVVMGRGAITIPFDPPTAPLGPVFESHHDVER